MKRGPLPLALLAACLLYLGFRALVLHTNFDGVAIPPYELGIGSLANPVVASGLKDSDG